MTTYKRRRSYSRGLEMRDTYGDDSNAQTMGASVPGRPTFKVPYTIRELKHHNRGSSGAGIPATTKNVTFDLLTNMVEVFNGISNGNTATTRVGNGIFARNCNFRVRVTADRATTGVVWDNRIRVVVFWDMDGTDPTSLTFGTLMNDPTLRISTAFWKPDYTSKIKVVHDKTYCLHGMNTTAAVMPPDHEIVDHIDLPINMAITYQNNIPDKYLYVAVLDDNHWSGTGGPGQPTFDITTQLIFTDT